VGNSIVGTGILVHSLHSLKASSSSVQFMRY
jgi:hypothetical protein